MMIFHEWLIMCQPTVTQLSSQKKKSFFQKPFANVIWKNVPFTMKYAFSRKSTQSQDISCSILNFAPSVDCNSIRCKSFLDNRVTYQSEFYRSLASSIIAKPVWRQLPFFRFVQRLISSKNNAPLSSPELNPSIIPSNFNSHPFIHYPSWARKMQKFALEIITAPYNHDYGDDDNDKSV